jgi:hypothetical protein
MNKKAYWFKHDFNARHDPKKRKLFRKFGLAGIGAYWVLVEMLYEERGEIDNDYDYIAAEMDVSPEFIKSVVNDFDLFIVDDEIISNQRVLDRLDEMKKKSEHGRLAASERYMNK